VIKAVPYSTDRATFPIAKRAKMNALDHPGSSLRRLGFEPLLFRLNLSPPGRAKGTQAPRVSQSLRGTKAL
jgi:hypothetical protein